MKFDELNDANFLIFAIKNYENPQAVTEDDFLDDLKRFKYTKRLLNKYLNGQDLNYNLVLNHIMILYNVFGEAATAMIFHKITNPEMRSIVKSFLLFLKRIPEYPHTSLDEIVPNAHCLNKLQKL